MRVTECAQQAVRHARGEAGRLGHDRIGTEHLLLALLRDQECLATAILGERGVEVEALRRRVEETAGPGQGDGPAAEDGLAAGCTCRRPSRSRWCSAWPAARPGSWSRTGSAPSTCCWAWPGRATAWPPGPSRTSGPASCSSGRR